VTADACSLTRFRELLDAYGADAERWPADERAAALALLACEPDARVALAAAAALDRVLDLAPAAEPSAALAGAVLAGAPAVRRRSRAGRALAVVVPLALAATLVVWFAGDRSPAPSVLTDEAVAELSRYTTPTDVLLSSSDEVLDTMPAIGCDAAWPGCPEPVDGNRTQSHRSDSERIDV
jgi:hypothetical protein